MTTPELIDRLEKWNWWAENTAKTFTKYTVTDKHFAELAEALTAAIAALRAAQEDSEKMAEAAIPFLNQAESLLNDPIDLGGNMTLADLEGSDAGGKYGIFATLAQFKQFVAAYRGRHAKLKETA